MKKILIAFTLVFFYSCESGSESPAEEVVNDKSGTETSTTLTTEIVESDLIEYYGRYESECIETNYIWHNEVKYTLIFNDDGIQVIHDEYINNNCNTPLATITYEITFEGQIIEDEGNTTILGDAEVLSSTLEAFHFVLDGNTDCGFPIDLNTKYELNTMCDANQTGLEWSSSILPQNDGTYNFNIFYKVINFTKVE